ncbi:MAG: hypothetical protein Roseis2KO_57190 [Roseivirga sp.]
MSSLIIQLFFISQLFLFLLGFFLPIRYFKKQDWFQTTGKKLIAAKEKQLRTNPLLKYFVRKVEEGAVLQARLIIATLICLKSIAMGVIAIVGISLIIIPIQALMTATLYEQVKLKGIAEESLSSVTGLQLATMLIATVAGNLIGWRVFVDDLTFTAALHGEHYAITLMMVVMLILSWFTASREVRFYKKNKTLLG